VKSSVKLNSVRPTKVLKVVWLVFP